jgi:hypothetical protein
MNRFIYYRGLHHWYHRYFRSKGMDHFRIVWTTCTYYQRLEWARDLEKYDKELRASFL